LSCALFLDPVGQFFEFISFRKKGVCLNIRMIPPKLSRFSQAEFAEQPSPKIQLLLEILALSLHCERGILTNKVTLLFRDGKTEDLPLMTKREVADRVLDRVVGLLGSKKRGA